MQRVVPNNTPFTEGFITWKLGENPVLYVVQIKIWTNKPIRCLFKILGIVVVSVAKDACTNVSLSKKREQ